MSHKLAALVYDFDLAAVVARLREVAKTVAKEKGSPRVTIPPAMTIGWIMGAMLDDSSGDGRRCIGSEAYFLDKTQASRATLKRVWALMEAAEMMSRHVTADGNVERVWHLDKIPVKAEWVAPKRGGYRGRKHVSRERVKEAQVEIKGAQVEIKGAQVEIKGAQVETNYALGSLPEVEPISGAETDEPRTDPVGIRSDPGRDPIVAGRIFDQSPLWIRMTQEVLRKEFSVGQYESWIAPLRLYRVEDGPYVLAGQSAAQVDYARKMVAIFRYAITRIADPRGPGLLPDELVIMRHEDLERAASHGGTALYYPPREAAAV